ncbi:hypothetical protein B0H13DRAFT_1924597 [Mycena leptocephala]|nr:hypothetical protein B0H13DRAFT_1924597 [Mycena leptocephala]
MSMDSSPLARPFPRLSLCYTMDTWTSKDTHSKLLWLLYDMPDNVRTSIASAKTISKVISMLEDGNRDIQRYALKTIMALMPYADVRTSICAGDTISKVLSMLGWGVRGNTLYVFIALVRYGKLHIALHPQWIDSSQTMSAHSSYLPDDVRISTTSGGTIPKVISMLEDENSVVQQNALDTIFVLAQCDDFLMVIYSPQTTLKIFSLLRDLDDTGPVLRVEEVITRLLAYLANDDIQNLPLRIEQILNLVDKCYRPDNYLRLIQGLLARHDTVAVIGAALIHNTLQYIYRRNADLRKFSYAIPSDRRATFMSMVSNPDPAILKCGVTIVVHFGANAQFRSDMFESNIPSICLRLLRRHYTTPMALEMLREFSKYNDTRDLIIRYPSEIVPELLSMMRAGTADFDRWQVGLKGLLALRLLYELAQKPYGYYGSSGSMPLLFNTTWSGEPQRGVLPRADQVALTLVAGLSHERQDNLQFEVPLDPPKKIRTLRRGSADPPKIQLWTSS